MKVWRNRPRAAAALIAVAFLAACAVQGSTPSTVGRAVPTCGGLPATIVGTSENDDLSGTRGADVIVALGGRDFVHGGGGADTICGGDGSDDLSGGSGADVIRGGAGNDWIEDALGANHVFGGAGDDVLRSGLGNEEMDGGAGGDIVDYSAVITDGGSETHCHDIVVDLTAGSGGGEGFGLDQLVAVEGAYSGGGDDLLMGDAGPNVFYGGGILCGRTRSDDHIDGLGGSDTLTFASDLIEFGSSDGPVRADLRTGEAFSRGNGGEHYFTFTSIENLDGTADHRDTLLGNGADNTFNAGWPPGWLSFSPGDVIRGRAGADTIFGMASRDELHGGPGPDVLRGRIGADELFGDEGNDLLDGGRGTNVNRGGPGVDECHRPSAGHLVTGCEAP